MTSGNGQVEALARLEAVSESRPEAATASAEDVSKHDEGKKPPKLVDAAPAQETGPLAEWLGADWVKAWARVKPSLAATDLRPYLFVAKDRKNYFGAVSVLGHLESVVDRLLGPKMAVQGFESELRLLKPPEADSVFEALRGRIVSAGALQDEPDGIQGIMVLAKAHPSLEGRIVDFLEALPTDRLGAWAVLGWENVIRDANVRARLEALLTNWSTNAKNMFLKGAAGQALKMKKSPTR